MHACFYASACTQFFFRMVFLNSWFPMKKYQCELITWRTNNSTSPHPTDQPLWEYPHWMTKEASISWPAGPCVRSMPGQCFQWRSGVLTRMHACMHPDTSRNGQYCFPKINKIAACMHAQTNHRNLVCPIIATDFAKGWTFGAPTMDSLHIRVGRVRRLTSGIAAPCWLVGPAEPMHLQDPDCDWAREATHFALGLQPFCIMNIILDIAHTACEWHYKNKC